MDTNTSLKTKQMNFILEKLSSKGKITQKEKSFLDSYERLSDKDFGEFSMLTSNEAESKIEYLIHNNIDVICNICDELGPLGHKINDIVGEDGSKILILEKNYTLELRDNCFYDLKYDIKKIRFSLESNNEYYELIPINNEN